MGRLAATFARHRGATGLIPYLTAGYPSLEATLEMALGLESAGACALEIGIPFSDPIADGPEIQRASEWSVRLGVGVGETLGVVRALRERSELPVVLMTYANPVLRHGLERFASEARQAGVDGVILSDLPAEESPEAWDALDAAGLDTILLVAPTTPAERLPLLLGRCRGFVYCLARTGVTGRSAGDSGPLPERIATLRGLTSLPVAVGFGISSAARARELKGIADALIVGAAFMKRVTEDPRAGAVPRVVGFARELLGALA